MQLTEHFTTAEWRCHDGTELPAEFFPTTLKLAQQLEVLRAELGKPITIISGYRSPEHNAAVDGATHSQHMLGAASDIVIPGFKPLEVHAAIERLIAAGKMHNGGLGIYDTFVHYDVRPGPARWDKRTKAAA